MIDIDRTFATREVGSAQATRVRIVGDSAFADRHGQVARVDHEGSIEVRLDGTGLVLPFARSELERIR